jgi:hypothetical protein
MVTYILLIVSMAVLGIEITYHSTLADFIKRKLRISIHDEKQLSILSTSEFWFKAFNNPFGYIAMLYFKFHYLILNIVNCQYCLTYHLSWISLTSLGVFNIWWSLILALPSLIIVKLISLIYEW